MVSEIHEATLLNFPQFSPEFAVTECRTPSTFITMFITVIAGILYDMHIKL